MNIKVPKTSHKKLAQKKRVVFLKNLPITNKNATRKNYKKIDKGKRDTSLSMRKE
jgi:hypothetical protein